MGTSYDYAQLAQYRHIVAELYAAVRADSDTAHAAQVWRMARDTLFHTHPVSALTDAQKAAFNGLKYADYDPVWRFVVSVDREVEPETFEAELPEGTLHYRRFAYAHFMTPDGEAGRLTLFWLMGYGGGLFLPFRDASNGKTTYGGGRYLLDTIKGADLGISGERVVLDFNFAYHPSCHYNDLSLCPLAPPENRLSFPVPVGEMSYPG